MCDRSHDVLLPGQVVYFGDSTMNDIFPSKHFAKWSTVQILNDIDRCVTSEDGKVRKRKIMGIHM